MASLSMQERSGANIMRLLVIGFIVLMVVALTPIDSNAPIGGWCYSFKIVETKTEVITWNLWTWFEMSD